jgi:hypothetical protein
MPHSVHIQVRQLNLRLPLAKQAEVEETLSYERMRVSQGVMESLGFTCYACREEWRCAVLCGQLMVELYEEGLPLTTKGR